MFLFAEGTSRKRGRSGTKHKPETRASRSRKNKGLGEAGGTKAAPKPPKKPKLAKAPKKARIPKEAKLKKPKKPRKPKKLKDSASSEETLLTTGTPRPLQPLLPLPAGPSPVSFLEFLKQERTQVGQNLRERDDQLCRIRQLEQNLSQAVEPPERRRIKQDLSLAREKVHQVPLTLAEFDAMLVPFLDLYYRRTLADESELIELFRREVHLESPQIQSVSSDHCEICGGEFIVASDESAIYCPGCARVHCFIDATSSNVGYGEEVEYTSFSYKRINHLNEYLNHIQAKESTQVPLEILQFIMRTLALRGLKIGDITFLVIKETLKALHLRRYYENAMQIWCRITGRDPLRLDPVCEEKIRLMFIQIQKPFEKARPPERKNFLSYPYVLHKFLQLLGHTHLLHFFPLLKGKDKLQVQEQIFAAICRPLGWLPFIPVQDQEPIELSIPSHTKKEISA